MASPHVDPIAMTLAAAALGVSLAAGPANPSQAGPTLDERVAALKQSLQDSQARIRKYEWIETTIVSLKGEEKTRRQQRCYYGADGALQKVPMGEAAPPPAQPSGRRGGRLKAKVVENKKDDMKEYMEQAVALVRQYVPPKPADIQRVKDAGKVTAGSPSRGQAQISLADYLKPGDRLSFDIDAVANRLLGLMVNTYMDKPEDAVTLDVQMGLLDDGTSHTAQTTLDAAEKKIRVVIQNAGYRPLGR
jgi:hypothetical protein